MKNSIIFKKVIFTIIIIFVNFTIGFSQNKIIINGKVSNEDNLTNDIIYLTNGMLDSKYYQISSICANISDNRFKTTTELSYPHLFTVNFESEKNKIRFRGGDYFIDSSTKYIEVSTLKASGCNYVEGNTSEEYKTKFIPFFIKNNDSCKSATIQSLSFKNDIEFDKKLLLYTSKNPDSYVALWALITRIRFKGNSILYERILDSFSDEIKKGKLWNIAFSDLESIRITEGEKFPELNLKNQFLNPEKLILPKAKYILVYYWFSNCKPCLKSFPYIKDLYNIYNQKGFEIVYISVDSSNKITNWKKIIFDYGLKGIQLLDENGLEAKKDKITSFPSTFLLNSEGKILKKNISIEELERFLKQNIK